MTYKALNYDNLILISKKYEIQPGHEKPRQNKTKAGFSTGGIVNGELAAIKSSDLSPIWFRKLFLVKTKAKVLHHAAAWLPPFSMKI